MIIKGITIFGQVVDVECNIADFLELVDVLEKAEKFTSEPDFDDVVIEAPKEVLDVKVNDPKKEDAIKAMKEAVAQKKKEKKYTDLDIVRMHDDEGMEMKEIAKITGIPYSTAWQRYHRVVK